MGGAVGHICNNRNTWNTSCCCYRSRLCSYVSNKIYNKRCKGGYKEFVSSNWEYIVIGILSIDKVVALSPTEWDDLIWTSIKKAIYKAVGK